MRKCSNKKNDFDSIVGPCLERLLKIRLIVFYLSFSLFEKVPFTLKFGDFKAIIQDTQEDTHGNMSLREGISRRSNLFSWHSLHYGAGDCHTPSGLAMTDFATV